MELFEKMDYVQRCAQKNAQLESQIKQLREKVQPLRMTKNTQEITDSSLPLKERLLLMIASDVLFGYVLNKILSSVLTLAVNGGRTRSQARAAGQAAYYLVPVIWPVGLILAIPLALFVTSLIAKKKLQKSQQKQWQERQDNEQIIAENNAIIEQNKITQERNQQIEEQINIIRQEQSQLIRDFTQAVPEYPADYLLPEIAVFVIQQIQSGKAESINQAIVQYVAVYEK